MKKLHRISKGEYYIEGVPYANCTTYIYKCGNLWLWNIDNGMTKGSFSSLKAAKKFFGIS